MSTQASVPQKHVPNFCFVNLGIGGTKSVLNETSQRQIHRECQLNCSVIWKTKKKTKYFSFSNKSAK